MATKSSGNKNTKQPITPKIVLATEEERKKALATAIAKIEKDYFVYRKRGYAEIDSLWLVDAKGHKYGNPAALTLYLGKIGDDAYIGYNVKDGYHTGKCLLRKAASFLEIKQE